MVVYLEKHIYPNNALQEDENDLKNIIHGFTPCKEQGGGNMIQNIMN